MLAIASLLIILILSVTVTKIATIALVHTGLSRQVARFQARSAFTGVGFTTNESEKLVNHPLRRRILMLLMILGSAGIVTAMSTLIVGMLGVQRPTGLLLRLGLLLTGLVVVWTAASAPWVDRALGRLVARALRRWTALDVRDYASLLQISKDYSIAELAVDPANWIADRHIRDLNLPEEGVLVLAIERPGGRFIGAPSGKTLILPNDTLVLYGKAETLHSLDQRSKGFVGEIGHRAAVREHAREKDRQLSEDEASPPSET